MRMIPGGSVMFALMISSVEPRPDRYVSQSRSALLTSSNRLNAKKSCFSL